MQVRTGLENLFEASWLNRFRGKIGYLCHQASVDSQLRSGIELLMNRFGPRFTSVFSPQHGFFSDAQDNMIETPDSLHPKYQIPVYSLYKKTRIPTDEMLDGLDHLLVDLQDVGCRPYTYVSSMLLVMQTCAEKDIEVVILDRPNPLNGLSIGGNILETEFHSFVGMLPIPMRHGMSIGELALLANQMSGSNCTLTVVPMTGWNRSFYFDAFDIPWIFPSPNMPHLSTAMTYPSTLIYEATTLTEGRGTTLPFELFGHPHLDPFDFLNHFVHSSQLEHLTGYVLRPLYFTPTFDKHAHVSCGGFQLHVTDRNAFRPWRTGLMIARELYHFLGGHFQWRQPPFEYEESLMPVDILYGTAKIRSWIESRGTVADLDYIEQAEMMTFLLARQRVLLYSE